MKKHWTAVEWLILALLLAAPLAAQNADFDKIATEALPAAPMQTTSATSVAKPEKVFDKKFFAVMGALGGAESFRFTSPARAGPRVRCWRSLGNQPAAEPTHPAQGSRSVRSRIPFDLRIEEVTFMAFWRPRHTQGLVGLSRRDGRDSHQERGWQRPHPGSAAS